MRKVFWWALPIILLVLEYILGQLLFEIVDSTVSFKIFKLLKFYIQPILLGVGIGYAYGKINKKVLFILFIALFVIAFQEFKYYLVYFDDVELANREVTAMPLEIKERILSYNSYSDYFFKDPDHGLKGRIDDYIQRILLIILGAALHLLYRKYSKKNALSNNDLLDS